MSQWAVFIKQHIEQLKNTSLSQWLLRHFHENANTLWELFSAPPGQEEQSTSPVSAQNIPNSLPVALFCAYAPLALREEFSRLFTVQHSVVAGTRRRKPDGLMPNKRRIIDASMNDKLTELLADYKAVRPIITALSKQGSFYLLRILGQAEEQSLRAFQRLIRGNDLTLLLETFLAKNNNELEQISRNRLIQLLRRFDFGEWLFNLLAALPAQAEEVLSLKLLRCLLTPDHDELDKIQEMKTLLVGYPFDVHLETVRAIIYFYHHALQKSPSDAISDAFFSLLYDIMMRMDTMSRRVLISELNQECFVAIINWCLSACASQTGIGQQHCKQVLLLWCSESAFTEPERQRLDWVKTRLVQPDDYLFDTPQSRSLAQKIGETATEPQGAWITEFLTSPHCVAVSTPREIQRLSDRYCLLSVTLEEEEHEQLIASLNDALPHADAIQALTEDDRLDNQGGLQDFINDSLTQALLIRLEQACHEEKKRDVMVAERALGVLYQYYSQVIFLPRTDLLLLGVDYAYRPWIADLAVGQSVLSLWCRNYIPEYLSLSWPGQQQKEMVLYKESGKASGFLNPSNKALALVDGSIVPLIDKKMPDEPFYDEQGTLLGYLTETGCMQCADSLQKNSSAHLLARVPEKELALSTEGLLLLVRHVVYEGALDALYEEGSLLLGCAKRLWLEQQITAVVQEATQAIPMATLNSLAYHHSSNAVFSLLASMTYEHNAFLLFQSILSHASLRKQFFSKTFLVEVDRFIDHHGLDQCLSFYMINFHKAPWFAQGFAYFAQCAKEQKKDHLLVRVLRLLAGKLTQDALDEVLNVLLRSEAVAQIVLKDFLHDNTSAAVQQIKNADLKQCTQYLGKKQFMVGLRTLNSMLQWKQSALYKLVLHLLNHQYEGLFEVKKGHAAFWQRDELNELAAFIGRHVQNKSPLDHGCSIGHQMLGELMFRSAPQGLVSLFYDNKQFNPGMMHLSFTQSFLERLIDKFCISEGIKEHLPDATRRIASWSDAQSVLQKELGADAVLTDWRHLIKQTWHELHKKKLPVICAYLLNYSGPKKPLACLLRDYIEAFQNAPDYLHPVARLLQQFPKRDVSAVIFDVLEIMVIKNPRLLDKTVLQCMACYYTKRNGITENSSPLAELHLLTYWGKRKQYALVEAGCRELSETCGNPEMKTKLLKAAHEAQVEADLSLSLDYFYFGLIKFFKRLWHYGFNAKENVSGMVAFCDDEHPLPKRIHAGDRVKTPEPNKKASLAYLEFSEKKRQLLNLLATIRYSPVSALTCKPSQSGQSLFRNKALVEKDSAVVFMP